MKKNKTIFCLAAAALLCLSACDTKDNAVKILRFDRFVFEPERYDGTATDFDSPLLNYFPDDPNYMDALTAFRDDPFAQHVYHLADSLYGDLTWLESDLGDAMVRAHELCPEVDYQRFYTLVTADIEAFNTRVFCLGHDMVIDLDLYLAKHVPSLQSLGLPRYLTRMCGREYLLGDCLAAAARFHIEQPQDHELTYLDYAIAEGKALYFTDKVLPSLPDTIKLRYTAEQLQWMEDNVQNVWGWLIQNNALFSNDHGQLHNLVELAPKTNAFGEGSAPRTHAWIGWQIVKQYMKKSGATVSELFANTDSRKILEQSGWRP